MLVRDGFRINGRGFVFCVECPCNTEFRRASDLLSVMGDTIMIGDGSFPIKGVESFCFPSQMGYRKGELIGLLIL